MVTDKPTLSDHPNEWTEHPEGFQQRWMPGAFGDLTTLKGFTGYIVEDDEWHEDDDGTIRRTIKRARVTSKGGHQ